MSIKTLYEIPNVPAPVGAYTPAVIFNKTAYISGQIPLHPETGQLVEGGIEEQIQQVLANCAAALKGVGSAWSKTLMTSIFLSDISHGPVVNKAYDAAFDCKHRPARQTVAVKSLPMGVDVEISLIAAVV